MGTWIGIALALVVTRGPTNGLDPSTLTGIYEFAELKVDSTDFAKWIKKDPEERAQTMKYFAYCALDESQVISAPPYGKWRGGLGLASIEETAGTMPGPDTGTPPGPDTGTPGPSVRRWRIGFAIPKGTVPAKKTDEVPTPGMIQPLPKMLQTRLDDERRWVSACLIAYTNMGGSHQYVSLRGHPPSSTTRQKLLPTPADRWTEGYPEGVFFGDLFWKPNGQEGDDLRSFTVSMDLPSKYEPSGEPPAALPPQGWQPPNANLGRTLDYRDRSPAEVGDAKPIVAWRLGTYHENKEKSFRDHDNAPGQEVFDDPDYHADQVCVTGMQSLDKTALAECGAGVEVLRPLFVHLPRLANLDSVDRDENKEQPFQVLDLGSPKINPKKQVKSCKLETCVGPFAYLSAGDIPKPPEKLSFGKRLVGLSAGQVLVPTLRFIAKREAKGLSPPPRQAYTAIIRYASPKASRAKVFLQKEDGGWLDTNDELWPPTTSYGVSYEWLQVYPVYPDGESVLRIKIEGVITKPRERAPELNAVGFVPGQPWCLDKAPELFMGICPSKEVITVPGSRPGIAFARSRNP